MEITLRDVWHTYDGFTYVLKNVNISFRKPGLFIIVGPNGAGKTTLLKILSLIVKPTKGAVLVDGKDFWGMDEYEKTFFRRRIVFVHDKPILLRGSVKFNIELGLAIRGVEDNDIVNHYVERYKLKDILDKPANKLSSGQAKIVSILRALVLDPEVLVLDEPFTFLDDLRQDLLLEDIEDRVKKNRTTIVSTHYMYSKLLNLSGSVIEVVSGRVSRCFSKSFDEVNENICI